MSVLTELLDRLSGVSAVREKVTEAANRLDRLGERLLDHERRLSRLETMVLEPLPRRRKGRPAT